MKSFPYYFMFLVVLLIAGPNPVMAQNKAEFKVVINHEEQYSIWPVNKKETKGWKATKISGNLAKCRDYIEEVWTDMRPLSIQKMNLPEDTRYYVVINHEEQYSIWPKTLAPSDGWRPTKFQGTLYPCVKYIEEVWTDMRPLSMRKMKKVKKN